MSRLPRTRSSVRVVGDGCTQEQEPESDRHEAGHDQEVTARAGSMLNGVDDADGRAQPRATDEQP